MELSTVVHSSGTSLLFICPCTDLSHGLSLQIPPLHFDAGADIKVMETEAFRQQKANEQANTEQQPQEPFMSFSPDEAAAARDAAAQEAAQRKAGAATPPDQAPPSQPAKTLTPKEAAAAALQKFRHEIDDLAKQVLSSANPALCRLPG